MARLRGGIGLLVVLASLSLAACGGSSSSTGSADDGHRDWLFSIQSTGTTTYDSNTGVLTMPAGSVQAFTDRPHRDSRVSSVPSFVDLWASNAKDSFEADPPNVVLTYWPSSGRGTPATAVCTIAGDVRYDSATRTLSMRLGPDGEEPILLPATIERASMFVDGLSSDCLGPVSPTTENDVEYFNLLVYLQAITLAWTGTPNGGSLAFYCSSGMPMPDDLDITLSFLLNGAQLDCNAPPTMFTTGVSSSMGCTPGARCAVAVSATSRSSKLSLSTTVIDLTLPPAGLSQTFVPELEPATIPIGSCRQVSPATQDVTISTNDWPLQLCSGAAGCGAPSGN